LKMRHLATPAPDSNFDFPKCLLSSLSQRLSNPCLGSNPALALGRP
jgi:hypothetical protein